MNNQIKFQFKIFCIAFFFSLKAFGSGIQVLSTTVTTDEGGQTATVKFSLTWDHSWRLGGTPSASNPANHDAAWVFIKYRTLPGDNWRHAYISSTAAHHSMPSNAAFKIGNATGVVNGINTTVGVGAFIFRDQEGSGTITFIDCELRWNFTQNGLTGGEQVEVCVLAIEMVHITQGTFTAGDFTSTGFLRRNQSSTAAGLTGQGWLAIENVTVNAANPQFLERFTLYQIAGHPSNAGTQNWRTALGSRTITSNAGIATPGTDDVSGSTRQSHNNAGVWPPPWNNNADNFAASSSAINANFPKGFEAFYCMKYEITQGEYLQFLNKNSVTVKNAYTYFPGAEGSPTVADNAPGRHAIVLREGTGSSDNPAEFILTTPAAAFLPMNYLNTRDIMGFLIWAGLRPMTELEFEKICRGFAQVPAVTTQRPQFAWGTIDLSNAAGFANKGGPNEGPSNTSGNAAVATTAGTTIGGGQNNFIDRPMRAGGFATAVSPREKAGASFFGVMEMSGNLWERAISLGNNDGRAFQGRVFNAHGNGETGPGANPDLPVNGGWPPATGQGLGFRGGSYLDHQDRARISDRMFINHNPSTTRHQSFGGRGVRTDL